MPYVTSAGARLYYEEAGKGLPVIFVHEFSGDLASWEAQLRYFSRRYRTIAFNARGYPPSDVPRALSKYSWALSADDIMCLMRQLKVRRAHVIGCSMGAYSTLQFGLRHSRMARSLTLVGAGAGSDPARRAEFLRNTEAQARRYLELGATEMAKGYLNHPARVQLRNKDPRGFAEFLARVSAHSALGSACTLRGVQAKRPSIYDLAPALRKLRVPLHVMCGDEDDTSIPPALFMKRVCASARLTMVAGTGHLVNLEEPALFNQLTAEFLTLVDSGQWRPRDPRSLNASTMAARSR